MLVTGDFKLIASSPRPIFSLKEKYLESGGATGGYFADQQEILQNSIRVFRRMVAGENMRNIPFTYPTMKYPKVDYLQLKSYGLLVDNCPKDTVFINKPQTFGKFVSTFDFLFFRKRHRCDSRWCKTFILCKQVSVICNHIFSYTSIKKQGISTFFVPQAYLGKLLFIQPRNLHKMHEVFTGILVQ